MIQVVSKNECSYVVVSNGTPTLYQLNIQSSRLKNPIWYEADQLAVLEA